MQEWAVGSKMNKLVFRVEIDVEVTIEPGSDLDIKHLAHLVGATFSAPVHIPDGWRVPGGRVTLELANPDVIVDTRDFPKAHG